MKLRTLCALGGTALVLGILRPPRRGPTDSRKTRYAEALPYLTRVFSELSKYRCVSEIRSVKEIEAACQPIVNRLAAAYSLITGTKCSVCIKTQAVGLGEDRPRVVTLCRDDASLEREQGVSPLETMIEQLTNPDAVRHWIDDNTAFAQFFGHEATPQRCYFSNNLPAEPDYHNTSFQIYGDPVDSTDLLKRDEQWPLPYKSTLVAPIGQYGNTRGSYYLIGFLAVDSRSKHVFSREHDIDLLLGIADSLSNLADRYQELVRKHMEGEDDGKQGAEGDENE